MHQPVAGIETEYGLLISGRTPHEQVEDAAQFVRCCPLKGFLGWDYRFESPRNDLRGFVLDHLAIDPIDRQFDSGRTALPDQDLKSDRVLANGGRFYNDHGHPEYATPECKSIFLLADHDAADGGHQREAVDVVVVEGVDAAGVAAAAGFEDAADHVEAVFEAIVTEDGEDDAELFGGEEMLLADLVFLDEEEGFS